MALESHGFYIISAKLFQVCIRQSQILALQPYLIHSKIFSLKRPSNFLSIDIQYVHIERMSVISHLIEHGIVQSRCLVHVCARPPKTLFFWGSIFHSLIETRGAIHWWLFNRLQQLKRQQTGNFVGSECVSGITVSLSRLRATDSRPMKGLFS